MECVWFGRPLAHPTRRMVRCTVWTGVVRTRSSDLFHCVESTHLFVGWDSKTPTPSFARLRRRMGSITLLFRSATPYQNGPLRIGGAIHCLTHTRRSSVGGLCQGTLARTSTKPTNAQPQSTSIIVAEAVAVVVQAQVPYAHCNRRNRFRANSKHSRPRGEQAMAVIPRDCHPFLQIRRSVA